MMYIEHTPLEDNLQLFLKNHISSSDANTILAHVREVGETVGTQLQTQARAEIAAAANATYAGYTGHLNVLRLGATARAKVPNSNASDPVTNNCNSSRRKVSTPVGGAINRNTATPKLNGFGNNTRAYDNGVDHNDDDDEEEVVENYELIDIVDDDQEESVNNQQQSEQVTKASEVKTIEKEHNTTETGAQFVIEIEGEEENYEYFVEPPAPKLRKYQNQFQEKPVFGHHCQPNNEPQTTRKRPLRPVPAAIPIKSWETELELPPLELIPTRPARQRVLNGQLRRSDSTESVISNYYLNEHDREVAAGYSYTNGYRRAIEQEDGRKEEDEAAEELQRQEYHDRYEDLPEILPGRVNSSQMGIDIFNRLRRLLNLNTDSATNNTQTQQREESHQRSGIYTADVNPNPIKYKKVQNRFPKIITHKLDDGDFDVISTFPKHEKQTLSCKSPSRASKHSLDMTQRKSLHSIEKPKYRKSVFTAPTVTHRLVKNTSYADVEFSDDDEPELVKGFGIGAPSGSILGGDGRAIKKVPRMFNIPIMRENEAARMPPASKPPPPPLIEPRTGSILATSLMPEIDLTKRKTLSYAEALRQNLPASGGHVLGRRSASSMSSSGATSASNGGFNILGNMRSSMWSTNARSILTQEKETEEHEKYQQLLEQVVPCLYGSSEGAHAFALPKPTFSFDAQQRRATGLFQASGTQKPITTQRKTLGLQNSLSRPLKRPPLSSTINLDDDDEENNEDVTFVSLKQYRPLMRNGMSTVIIDDDDEISEIIDLDDDERQIVSQCIKSKDQTVIDISAMGAKEKKKCAMRLPYVEPVNTLQERFNTSPHLKENWLEVLKSKWTEKKKSRLQEVNDTVNVVEKLTAERRVAELEMQDRLRKIQIVDPDLLVIDDFPEPEISEEPEFVELTPEYQARIKAAIIGPPDQVLVSKFNLNITRRDIHTLLGNNWLNDEVINFYMNLITERGETKHETHGLPNVYAMNTFFIPRLLSAGHSGVKRWTRKVDIFSKDIIPVPVHVGGVHWCMAIIHIKNNTIKYYDSMGTPNPSVLKALEQYLKDESLDKRKQPYDTSSYEIESVREVPRQMNGSDCGVFSCMFAEYITRNREITFSQQHMEYFRHKMILEIVRGELLQ